MVSYDYKYHSTYKGCDIYLCPVDVAWKYEALTPNGYARGYDLAGVKRLISEKVPQKKKSKSAWDPPYY